MMHEAEGIEFSEIVQMIGTHEQQTTRTQLMHALHQTAEKRGVCLAVTHSRMCKDLLKLVTEENHRCIGSLCSST